MKGALDRIVVLEKTIKPPARPATPDPSRLTVVEAAQLRALCLTADAGGGLDVPTADEAVRGADLMSRLDDRHPYRPGEPYPWANPESVR